MSDFWSKDAPVKGGFWENDAPVAASPDALAAQAKAAQPHSLMQKIGTGMADTGLGLWQALAHNTPSSSYLPMPMTTGVGGPSAQQRQEAGQGVDTQIADRERQWQQQRAATGDTGTEWARGAGQALAAAPLAALIPGGQGVAAGALSGAAQGALSGALQPVTQGNFQGQKAGQIGVGAGIGGALGGVLGWFGKKAPTTPQEAAEVTRTISSKLTSPENPLTQEQIKAASTAAYKTAEQAGVVISPDSFTTFANDLPNQLKGYHPAVDEPTNKLIGMLQSEATNGPMTLDKLDALRSVASAKSVSRDLNDARLAGAITSKIDGYIDNIGPKDLIEGSGNADAATSALTDARSLWRVSKKLETINDIVDTGEVLNDPNWVKGRFRALVKSSQFDRYTQQEQDAIASVARTGNLEKAIKLIPWRGVQMASTYADPLMQSAKIGTLQNTIARGGSIPPGPVGSALSSVPVRLAGQIGQRTLPYIAGGAASSQAAALAAMLSGKQQ